MAKRVARKTSSTSNAQRSMCCSQIRMIVVINTAKAITLLVPLKEIGTVDVKQLGGALTRYAHLHGEQQGCGFPGEQLEAALCVLDLGACRDSVNHGEKGDLW